MTTACLFARNTGPLDRLLRVVVGGALLLAAAAGPRVLGWSLPGGAVAVLGLVVGAALVLTGAVGRCPLYALTGVRPCPPAAP